MTTTAGAERSRLLDVAASLLLVLPVAAVVAAFMAWRDRLPDPFPRHWNLAGEVDGTTALGTFVSLVVGAVVGLALLGLVVVWAVRSRDVAGFTASLAGGLAWFLSSLFVGSLAASLDVVSAGEVELPVVGLVAGAVIGLLVAFALSKLVPALASGEHAVAPPSSSLTFDAGEKVVWIGSASSSALRWIGVAVAVAGGVGVTVAGLGSLILLLVGVVMALTSTVATRIDDAGVRVRWTALGVVGTTTPLAQVTGVEVTQARPGEWGGWGYRLSSRGTAHLVRAGEAIVLQRRGRKDLLITVDGAEQACDVLAGLLARQASSA